MSPSSSASDFRTLDDRVNDLFASMSSGEEGNAGTAQLEDVLGLAVSGGVERESEGQSESDAKERDTERREDATEDFVGGGCPYVGAESSETIVGVPSEFTGG